MLAFPVSRDAFPPDAAMHRPGIARASVICIVTECRVLGDALTYMLRLRAGLRRITVLRNVATPVAASGTLRPTVVLLDQHPGVEPGVRAEIERMWPGVVVVVLGGSPPRQGESCGCASRERRIPRDAGWEELLDALSDAVVHRNDSARKPPSLGVGRDTAHETEGALSAREREIAALIEHGLSNREIAARLGVSVATVKNHVHHILTKLHAHSRGQAVAQLRAEQHDSRC